VKIPGVLDRFADHEPATYPLTVSDAQDGDDTTMTFDPREFMERALPPLDRPKFLAIVSSNTLATSMCKRANGRVDGFVIEGPTSGGHNAPPRGKPQPDGAGEASYGERDRVDLEKIRELGLPFWLAGGYGAPGKLREAMELGAAGVQVGTAFAFCAESGLKEEYKSTILASVVSGEARVSTDGLASPTGFPFKVAQLKGSLSEREVYAARPRICDLGYLREAYRSPDGTIGYRCPAEPVTLYVSKGGKRESTVGKKCLCNSLMATIGHPQARKGKLIERALVTSGDDLPGITRFLPPDGLVYSATDVVAHLLNG
jgi:nitronate monooxygenase